MTEIKQYSERDAMELDEVGGHYFRHVLAMTSEGLHSKSEIAAELGWRDMQIALLREQLSQFSISAGQADQRKAESDVVREALGFSADSDDVAPRDLVDAIASLQEQVRALEHEKYKLTQYKAAYVEWQDKTEWVQGEKRFDVLLPWGKHRADILKDYVERVEGQMKDEIARRDMAAAAADILRREVKK